MHGYGSYFPCNVRDFRFLTHPKPLNNYTLQVCTNYVTFVALLRTRPAACRERARTRSLPLKGLRPAPSTKT